MVHTETPWPEELSSIGALRFARRSAHFAETVGFDRDLVGLPLCATFEESFGSTGAIFGLPGSDVTFEIVEATEPVAVDGHEQLCCISPTPPPNIVRRPVWLPRASNPLNPIPIGRRPGP